MTIRTLLLLILSLIFTGCTYKPSDIRLSRVESFSSESPKEAWDSLGAINYNLLSDADKHYYDFLSVKVSDKAYITHTSDSLILKVIDFESKHKGNNRYPEALYYGGRVYSDLGDYPKSLKYFYESLSYLSTNEIKDLKLKSSILSQIGRLFNTLRIYDRAIPYLEETIKIDSLLKDSINLMYDKQLLGIINLHAKNYQEAERNLTHSNIIALRLYPNDLHQIAQQNLYLAASKYYKGDINAALTLIKNVPQNIHPVSYNTALAYAAEIYNAAGIQDSAYYYAHKLINTTDYLNHKTGYHILLSDQLRSFIDQDSLIEYIYNYQDILEQYINTNNIQTVAVQNSFFNYQFIEAEKDKFDASKKVRGHWLIACSIAIIFLLIFVLILKYKNKSQLLKLYDALDNIQVLKHRLEIQQSDINNSNINIETSITSDSISIKTPSPEDLREKLRTELLNLYEANQDYNIPSVIIQSEAYQILRQHISSDKLIKENSKLWSLLEQTILECSPNFKTNLLLLTNGKLTSQDLKMAYLIKCGVLPSQMTALLGRTKGTISSRRESICLKVFDKNMGVKVIDGIIRSL